MNLTNRKEKVSIMNIHYAHQSEMYSDEHGTAYNGPAICGAIGSYATHYPVLVNCERCREILRQGNWGPEHPDYDDMGQ